MTVRGAIASLSPVRVLRRPAGDDAGIALVLVLVLTLIVTSLSVLVLGAILTQVVPTRFQRKNTQTFNAAEAGLDTGLAAIRASTYSSNGVTYGDRAGLPCWSGYTGSVGDPGGTAITYTVSIAYFADDPSAQTAAWRAANSLSCTIGLGTPTTPAYAFITSAGSGPALPNRSAEVGNRTLQTLYTFSTTNPTQPGGLIADQYGYCYTGSATAGVTVTLSPCRSGDPTQLWAYNSTYQLVLTSTRNADGTGGLCISAAATIGTPLAVMATCSSSDYKQKWGLNSALVGQYFYSYLTGVVVGSPWCLAATTANSAGSSMTASPSKCGGNYNVVPTAAVGPGAAGTTSSAIADVDGIPMQWVSYAQFGRCFDLANWNLQAPSEIVYPCKQDPLSSLYWNQVFTWSSSSQLFWVNAGAVNAVFSTLLTKYCMMSPGTEGGYVTFKTTCSSVTAATRPKFTWTVNRGSDNRSLAYTIVDSFGRCLTAGPANPAVFAQYRAPSTSTCDGSTSQKWNAPPSLDVATVSDTAEVANH